MTEFGCINKKEEIVIKPQFQSAWAFKNGWAKVMLNGSFGVVNKSGHFIRGEIVGDLIRVCENTNCEYYNLKGVLVWKPQ